MKSWLSPPLTGWHVLAMLFAFFGVIFAVNGVFVYVAESTWSGLETRDPYIKGLDYNDQIAFAEAQHRRGWKAVIEQGDNELTISYHDKNGAAIDDLDVTAILTRAATNRYDSRKALKAVGNGRYSVAPNWPVKGQWLLKVEASQGGKKMHIIEEKIFVK